jgi:hypothetical protein
MHKPCMYLLACSPAPCMHLALQQHPDSSWLQRMRRVKLWVHCWWRLFALNTPATWTSVAAASQMLHWQQQQQLLRRRQETHPLVPVQLPHPLAESGGGAPGATPAAAPALAAGTAAPRLDRCLGCRSCCCQTTY